MAKRKTTEHYEKKRADIKKRKRKLTSTAGGRTSEEVKNEKKRLKEEYRGLKRSERQQVKRQIDEDIEETEALKIIVGDQYESERAEAIDDLINGRHLDEEE